jgi:glyoxalase superfamily protein
MCQEASSISRLNTQSLYPPQMHRSRLSTLLIDAPMAEAPRSAAFWSAALGVDAKAVTDEPQFISLPAAVPGLVTAVQAVDDDARYHVDIETDDVAAEVARLTALGAEEESVWQGCHALRVPGGHLLCVIPLHSDPAAFAAAAHVWP